MRIFGLRIMKDSTYRKMQGDLDGAIHNAKEVKRENENLKFKLDTIKNGKRCSGEYCSSCKSCGGRQPAYVSVYGMMYQAPVCLKEVPCPDFERKEGRKSMSKHDMSTIVHPINLLVSDEYDWSAAIHGSLFASVHEGYGVIAEEVMEAENENAKIIGGCQTILAFIQQEDMKKLMDAVDAIRDAAVNCAAEMIQVAAMCEKLAKTVREEKHASTM